MPRPLVVVMSTETVPLMTVIAGVVTSVARSVRMPTWSAAPVAVVFAEEPTSSAWLGTTPIVHAKRYVDQPVPTTHDCAVKNVLSHTTVIWNDNRFPAPVFTTTGRASVFPASNGTNGSPVAFPRSTSFTPGKRLGNTGSVVFAAGRPSLLHARVTCSATAAGALLYSAAVPLALTPTTPGVGDEKFRRLDGVTQEADTPPIASMNCVVSLNATVTLIALVVPTTPVKVVPEASVAVNDVIAGGVLDTTNVLIVLMTPENVPTTAAAPADTPHSS